MGKANGFVVYDGPSALDGAPIVAIATGTARPSENRKTGAMVQVWVLPRDASPIESVRTGADASVCGDCPLRGMLGKGRGCYVDLAKAPGAVWNAYHRGVYPAWDGAPFARPLRLGAWGDPAALPIEILEALAAAAPQGHTGYTHQWASLPASTAKRYRALLMASVETSREYTHAQYLGWRTFRVLPIGSDIEAEPVPSVHRDDRRRKNEIICPASPEGGDRAACATCGLCNGSLGKGARDPRASIAILAHGAGARNVANIGGPIQ